MESSKQQKEGKMDIDLREDEWLAVISERIPTAKAILRYHFSPLFQQIGVTEQQGEEILGTVLGLLRQCGTKSILYFQSW